MTLIRGRKVGATLIPAVILAALLATVLAGCKSTAGPGPTPPATKKGPSVAQPGQINAGDYLDPKSPTFGLQAAIDAAAHPAGGIVVLPPGTYALRRSLVLASRVTLRGSGQATVLKMEAEFVTPLAADAPSGATEIQVQDASRFRAGDEIGIREEEDDIAPATTQADNDPRTRTLLRRAGGSVGGKHNGWQGHQPIVTAVEGNRVLFDRPTEFGYLVANQAMAVNHHPAISARDKSDLTIENLRIEGTRPSGTGLLAPPANHGQDAHATPPCDFVFEAIHLITCWRVRISAVTVADWPSDGIGLQGGGDCQVIGCTVTDCRGHGYHLGTGLIDSTFTGDIARANGGNGLYFCQDVRQCTVSGGTFHGNAESGIGGLGNTRDQWNVCSGNVCSGNGIAGIVLLSGRNNSVVGNVCVNNSKSGSILPGSPWPGILLKDTSRSLVAGNRCGDDQTPPTQVIGIAEIDASDDNLITANHVGGCPRGIEKVGKNTKAIGNLP